MQILEGSSIRSDDRDYRILCSAAILASRSQYLRSLIERRLHSDGPIELVMNERVFPRIYAQIFLYAVYTDSLDFTKVSFIRYFFIISYFSSRNDVNAYVFYQLFDCRYVTF